MVKIEYVQITHGKADTIYSVLKNQIERHGGVESWVCLEVMGQV